MTCEMLRSLYFAQYYVADLRVIPMFTTLGRRPVISDARLPGAPVARKIFESDGYAVLAPAHAQ
jgi:hypothetical protein